MTAKPIRELELHYPMIQLLIILVILGWDGNFDFSVISRCVAG